MQIILINFKNTHYIYIIIIRNNIFNFFYMYFVCKICSNENLSRRKKNEKIKLPNLN